MLGKLNKIHKSRGLTRSIIWVVLNAGCLVTLKLHAQISFTPFQADVYTSKGSQAVAWADYDLDGDLDFAVSFKNGLVQLFQQNNGYFTQAGGQLGFPKTVSDYRSLSWGDFNNDGFPDLFIGFGRDCRI